MFISADEEDAKRIHDSLNLYFGSARFGSTLIPPWSSVWDITEEQVKARATLRKLQGFTDDPVEVEEAPVDSEDTTEEERLYEEIANARRRGLTDRVETIQKKIESLEEARETKRLDDIRALGPDVVHLEFIDLYTAEPVYERNSENEAADEQSQNDAYAEYNEKRMEWRKQLAVLLGQLPLTDGEASLADKRFGATGGYTTRIGLIHQISYVTLNREVDGVTAITEWLCARGCVDVKYQFGHVLEDLDF